MRILVPQLLVLLMLMPALAQATPVWTDGLKADALIERVSANQADAGQAIGELAGLLHLDMPLMPDPVITRPPFAASSEIKFVSTDLQLAMTQLSIHIGANNQILVLRAQADRRDALILQNGFSTLRNLVAVAEKQGFDGLRMVDGVAHLSRPLIVWLGAGLQLEPGDILQMDASGGAFLLGFGQVEIVGATVKATSIAAGPKAYRPFVLITGQGTLYAEDSQFAGLGNVGADPFGGVTVSQRGLFQPKYAATITKSRFDDVGVIGMTGVTNGIISDNTVVAGRSTAIALDSVQGGQVSGNAVIGTKGTAGIKVANGANVHVAGNLVYAGAHNGISIGANSKAVEIVGNAVLANSETGINAQRSNCVSVISNSIARNGASGLRMTENGVSRVQGNAVVLNTTAGLHVGKQNKGGRIEISENLLAGNRVGLSGLEIGEVLLEQNNLTAQMPRLFDGEFSQYLAAYLTQVQQQSNTSYRIAAAENQSARTYLTTCNKG